MVGSINTSYKSEINYYPQKNVLYNKTECYDKTINEDYQPSANSEQFHTYFTEFRKVIKGSDTHSYMDVDKNLESLSYKYKELSDAIDNRELDENEKNEKLGSLNHVFEIMNKMVVSNQAFSAKSDEIHRHLIAKISKDIIDNPDKEIHNKILMNHDKIMEKLNNAEKNLLNCANVYYEAFINSIKNTSIDEAIYNSLKEMKSDDLLPMSYYDTKDVIDTIYEE